MNIFLDRTSPVALRDQIVAYFETQISLGVFPGGMRLPSVRTLASQIRVNPSTVREAYAELACRDMVEGQGGRGTFVRMGHGPAAPLTIDLDVAREDPHRSIVYTTMVAPGRTDILSLDQQVPAPHLLPFVDLDLATRHIWNPNNQALHHFGDPQGLFALRERLAHLVAWRGVTRVRADDLLVTSGVVQGLFLCLSLLCRKGDGVIVESPTWGVALSMLDHLGLVARPVPLTPEGMDIDEVDRILERRRARAIFTVPCGHNPTGVSSSVEQRTALLDVARRHGVPIIEDDIYGLLGLSGEEAPSLLALDDERAIVFSLTGVSKSLGPAFRLGWMVPPPRFLDRFIATKQNLDLHTNHIVQYILERYLSLDRFDAHLRRTRGAYKEMRDARIGAVRDVLGDRAEVHEPAGGFALWVRLNGGMPAREIVSRSLRDGVYATPGACFFPVDKEEEGDRFLRLSFTLPEEGQFLSGLRVLAKAMRSAAAA